MEVLQIGRCEVLSNLKIHMSDIIPKSHLLKCILMCFTYDHFIFFERLGYELTGLSPCEVHSSHWMASIGDGGITHQSEGIVPRDTKGPIPDDNPRSCQHR